jgi:hypothetical protein
MDGYILRVGNSCERKLAYAYLKVGVSHINACSRKMNTDKGTLVAAEMRFATSVEEENLREGMRYFVLKMN